MAPHNLNTRKRILKPCYNTAFINFHCITTFFIVLLLEMGYKMSDAALSCYSGSSVNGMSPTLKLCNSSYQNTSLLMTSGEHMNCYIFKYRIKKKLENSLMWETSYDANFSCDDKDVCGSLKNDSSLSKSEQNGLEGELYCCRTNGCNNRGAIRDMRPKQLVCFNYSTNNYTASSLSACSNNVTNCAKLSPHSTKNSRYFCDDIKLCQANNVKDGSCKNITVSRHRAELCCCERSDCDILQMSANRTKSKHGNSARRKHHEFDMVLTLAFAASLLLCVLVVLTSWLVTRKYCNRTPSPFNMSYRRTSAAQGVSDSNEVDDVQMLLG